MARILENPLHVSIFVLMHKDAFARVVLSEHNRTTIAPVSEFGREAIRSGLYSPGELLRLNELNPDLEAAMTLADQLNLFGRPFAPVV